MGAYVARRLVTLVPVMLGISIVVFLAINMVPGNAVQIMLGIEATPEMQAVLEHQLGLDRPVYVRYALWLGRLLRGDFGRSIVTGLPVSAEIASRFGVTLQLIVLATVLSVLVAIPLGIISALRQDSAVDFVTRIGALAGISLPGFAIGVLLILVASRFFGWYPSVGFVSLWERPLEAIQILALPVVSLGMGLAASTSRMTRAMILEVLRQDYVRTARSKGLHERVVIYRHALKNAVIPIMTIVGMQVGYLLGGTVVVEEVFSLPGLGRLILTSIFKRD